jgi:FixJ family two-component response regulator
MPDKLRISLTIEGIDAGAMTRLAVALTDANLLKSEADRSPLPPLEPKRKGSGLYGQQLTPRERQVLDLVVAGRTTKEAGKLLGISPRTAEVHRFRVMEKLGARNLAHLLKIERGDGVQWAEGT